MARSQDCGVFDLDEDSTCSDAGAGGARSPSTDDHDIATTGGPSDRSSIDPFRRAMPQLEAEEDVCSICLDAFTDDDPGNATVCGHNYHLQCIMQWAQRSRECPLCFRALALQDAAMQELLPFGEYVPPDNAGIPAAFLGFEAWDMDALLQRLALQSGAHARRSRNRPRNRTHSLQAPTPGGQDAGMSALTARARPTSSQSQDMPATGEDSFPSSWPPRGMSLDDSQTNGSQGLHRLASGTDNKSTAESLKSRWYNFRSSFQSRCRESLNSATSGLKGKADKGEPQSQGHHPQ